MIKLKAGDFIYLQYMDEVIEITKEGVEESKGTEFEFLREDELMATEKQIKEYKSKEQASVHRDTED